MGERRGRSARLGAVLLGLGLAWTTGSCASEPAAPPPAAPAAPASDFSGDAAFAHLKALTDLGPRISGTPAAEKARAYVRGQLEKLGLKVTDIRGDYRPDEGAPVALVNLVAEIPARPDAPAKDSGILAVGAPLDTAPVKGVKLVGANEGASGAAVVLELARVLHAAPLPYPVHLMFFDGEHLSEKSPGLGSRLVAADYARRGELDKIRLLLVLTQVGDRDLTIHRDLLSDRTYRDAFFDAAERMGYGKIFDRDGAFDQIQASQVSFFDMGLRRVVVLADVRYGGDKPPGSFWRTAADDPAHCSAESLGVVGAVALQGLRDISGRLQLVDSLVRHRAPSPPAVEPGAGTESPATKPGSEAAPTSGAEKPAPAPGAEAAPTSGAQKSAPSPGAEAAPTSGAATPAPAPGTQAAPSAPSGAEASGGGAGSPAPPGQAPKTPE